MPSRDSSRRIPAPSGARAELRRATPAVLRRARHSVTEWMQLSRCPRAYEWSHIRPKFHPIQEQSISEDAFGHGPSRQELGSLVHSCLERNDEEGLLKIEREAGSARFQAGPLIRWAREAACMRPVEDGREVWTELAFEVPVGDEILVGSMDRVVRDAQRAQGYEIIDFKVTSARSTADTLIQNYGMQLGLYAFALRRLLPSNDSIPIRATLVQIAPDGVRTVEIPLVHAKVEQLAHQAAKIVEGAAGDPRPSPACRYCAHIASCLEGGLYSSENRG